MFSGSNEIYGFLNVNLKLSKWVPSENFDKDVIFQRKIKMGELNYLWEILQTPQSTFLSNSSFLNCNKSNCSFDFYEEHPLYKNFSSWEDLQKIFQGRYNRSLHFYSKQQRNTDQDCHPFGNMFVAIYSYYIPSMIFVGLLGNLLSCFVFLNTHLKMRSSSYYLAALACADFGFLAALFLVWLNSNLGIPVFNIEGYCQCIVYVSSVCSFLSVWLIAAFTVERFIAIQYPLHRPHMCTIARAKAIVFYLVCISLTLHTYVFVTSGITRSEDGSETCEMLEDHREAMRVINIIDSVLTLIVPLFLIIIMNAMIVHNLLKFSKKFKTSNNSGNKSEVFSSGKSDLYLEILRSANKSTPYHRSRKNTVHNASILPGESSIRRHSHFKVSTKSDGSNGGNRERREEKLTKMSSDKKLINKRSQQSITKMLLLISTVFILLNLPSYGIRLYAFIFFSIWSEPPPILFWCLQQMFMILFYTNFSINFILYSMCGITFRRCLWQFLRKRPKKIFKY